MWVKYLLQREKTVSTLENPQRSWHLFHFRSRFFCLLLNSLQPASPALRAPPTSPIAESRLILANAMGRSNFPTWLSYVFLGFSPSLSVAINLKCFVILSDVVLSACAWEYTVHIPAKKTKVRLFLDIKPSFNKIIICQVVCLNCIHMSTSLNGGVLYLIWLHFLKTYHLA